MKIGIFIISAVIWCQAAYALACPERIAKAKETVSRGAWSDAMNAFWILADDCICREYMLFEAGVCAEKAGDIPGLQKVIARMSKAFPNSKYTRRLEMKLADYYFNKKQWKEVLRIVGSRCSDEHSLFLRACALAGMNRLSAAADLFGKLWVKYPAGKHAEAVTEQYRQVLLSLHRNFPEVESDELYQRARNLDKAGLRLEAAKIYSRIISGNVSPAREAKCRLYYAKILHDTRENHKALAQYRAFLKKFPRHESVPTVYQRMGTIYRRLKQDSDYLNAVSKIITTYKNSRRWAEALISRGEFHRGSGALRKAASDFDRVIRRGGKLKTVAQWKKAWIFFDRKDYAVAAKLFRSILKRNLKSAWEPQCAYWSAVCLDKTGKHTRALQQYSEIVEKYPWTYSGILAASRLKELHKPISFTWSPSDSVLPEVSGKNVHFRCAKLLMRAGYFEFAADEWKKLHPDKSSVGIRLQIAECYYGNKEITRARRLLKTTFAEPARFRGMLPRTAARILYPHPEDIWKHIVNSAAENHLDPNFVASVILQESGFDEHAFSHNLAAGYMQLMPELFRRMSKNWIPPVTDSDRFKPEYNIRAGSQYLRFLLDRYNQSFPKALAAYNAGEHRVDKWQKQFPDISDEEWTEHIPFSQTRLFVKHILANYKRYQWIYRNSGEKMFPSGS